MDANKTPAFDIPIRPKPFSYTLRRTVFCADAPLLSALSPRRSNAEYRWTRDKVLVFLRVLALRGSVSKAAREVG